MRADRLIAALLVLQARERVTAAELATELDVSLATARRDLEALSAAGIPVYPQAGRHGGWQLLGGARTNLTGLTASESAAVFALLGPSAGGSAAAKSALRKLLRALPETFRADAAAAADAVVIDASGWGELPVDRPPWVQVLQSAVVRRRQVRLVYGHRDGEREVTVDPLGLAAKDDVWHLVAQTPRGQRTYRLDRVLSVDVTTDVFARPDDFDLPSAWVRIVGEMESRRSVVTATALADPRLVEALRANLGRHLTVDGPGDDGRVRVTVSAHLHVAIAEQLAGWGRAVEVVEPDVVQRHLARLGADLTALYGGRGDLTRSAATSDVP